VLERHLRPVGDAYAEVSTHGPKGNVHLSMATEIAVNLAAASD